MATAQEIQQWFSANPNATDAQIYSAMRKAGGVTPEEIHQAMGGNLAGYQARFNTAAAAAASPAASPGSPVIKPTQPQGSSLSGADLLNGISKANQLGGAVTSLVKAITAPPSEVILSLAGEKAGGGLLGSLLPTNPISAILAGKAVIDFINSRSDARKAKNEAERAEYLRTHPWASVMEKIEQGSQTAFDVTSVPYEVSANTGWIEQDMGTPEEVARKVIREELKPWQNPDGTWVAMDQEGYISPLDPDLLEKVKTESGGGGGGSSGGSSGQEGDIGSLEPDPDLMGGDTIRAGNGWLYPNEKISSESSYPVKVHTNPDGSRVVVYSDGSERWDATSGVNPDFSKWPNRPQPSSPIPETSTRTTDEWVPIIKDWLIQFPNASEAEKQEAIQKHKVPAEAIQKAQEGIGTGGQGTGTGAGSGGSGDSTGSPVTSTQPTPQTPTLPRPGPSPAPNAGPQVTPGTGVGPGTGPGTGTGGGNVGGTGGLLGLNATRTTEMVFPELYQPKLERFTVLGNLLSNQPWRYRA